MPCGDSFTVPIADITAILDCCTLTFNDTVNGEFFQAIDLHDLHIISTQNGVWTLLDGKGFRKLTDADLAALGLTIPAIQAAADACRCSTGGGGPSTDYEIKKLTEKCFRDQAIPADIYTRVICIPFTNGVPGASQTWWVYPNGTASQTAPAVTLEECPEQVSDIIEIETQCLTATETTWLIDNEQDSDCGSYASPYQWAPDSPPCDYEIMSFTQNGVELVTGAPILVTYPPEFSYPVEPVPPPTGTTVTVTGDATPLLGYATIVFRNASGGSIGFGAITGAIFAAGVTDITFTLSAGSPPIIGGSVEANNVEPFFVNLGNALATLTGEPWTQAADPTCANVLTVAGSTSTYGDFVLRRTCDGQVFRSNVAAQGAPVETTVYKVTCFIKDVAGQLTATAPVYFDYDDPTVSVVPTPAQIAAFVPCDSCCENQQQQQNQIYGIQECWIDDINGDGSVIESFTRVVRIDLVTGQSGIVGDYQGGSLYSISDPANISLASSLNDADAAPRYVSLVGPAAFSLPANSKSVSLQVVNVDNILSPPTLDTGAGIQPLYEGFIGPWGQTEILTGTFNLSLNANDIVAVSYIEFV